jgi:hypothetical protein
MWTAVLLGTAGCYALKLAGLSVPQRLLDSNRIRRIAALLPVALLAALIGIGTLATDEHLTFDERVPGLLAAAVALRFKAPFLVVVGAAAATSAFLRAVA